jgi:hypothetical protein
MIRPIPKSGAHRYLWPVILCLMYGYMYSLPMILVVSLVQAWIKYSDTMDGQHIFAIFFGLFTDAQLVVDTLVYVTIPMLIVGIGISVLVYLNDRKKIKEPRKSTR